MTKKDYQLVITEVASESDAYMDSLRGDPLHPTDRATYVKILRALCLFLKEAEAKGYDVSSAYTLEEKLQYKEVKND